MSEYSKDFDWRVAAKDILTVFYAYPLDNQLVWLFELILLRAFSELKRKGVSGYLDFDGETYYLKPKQLSNYLKAKGLPASCYGRLLKYRNLFVHAGVRGKAVLLFLLKEHRNDLAALADYVHVRLNFDDIRLLEIKG